ncbi:PA2169 family four-helix-bundle protein [Mucilaginibacter sp.]|uniref:PA2169 family four-helix-bundle protein n=1 Tax=Mucilaginibacter sp. TaxID=1882438 RepID=UPI003D127A51
METIEKSIEVLNDLIEINNDRVAGFAHAAKELEANDNDLKIIFETLRDESRENVHELTNAINQNGGEAETGTSGSGALHRAWLDVKATFTGHDRKSILEECERGEDAIKKAYQDALLPDSGLSPAFTSIVSRQQQGIIIAHNKIKALRDSQA